MQRTSSSHSLRGWDTLASSGQRPARQQNSTATHATDAPCSSGPTGFTSRALHKVRLGLPMWSAAALWPECDRACCQSFTAPADMQMIAVLLKYTCEVGPVAGVGQPFAVAGGLNGKQGMLLAVLRDMLAGCAVVAATTHLKAKAGQVGWLTREACTGSACLYTSPTFATSKLTTLHGLIVPKFVAHLELFECPVQANEAARQVQAELMMERISAAARNASSSSANGASSAPGVEPLLILCGDFNDSPSSPACQARHLSTAQQGMTKSSYSYDRGTDRDCNTLVLDSPLSAKLLMQVVKSHQLGLQCIWDAACPTQNSSNGASSPEQEPFTTWKFRSEGVSKRTIDYIWWALGQLASSKLQSLCHMQLCCLTGLQ